MLVLCVWALAVLAAGSFVRWDPATQTILDYVDTMVCGLFFIDFPNTLARSPQRLRYLLTWGWIDFISSIPTIGIVRWGRAARVMRILRVMRGVKSARAIAHYLVAKRAESAFGIAPVMSADDRVVQHRHFAVRGPRRGNIATAQDAIWWAVSTMTTVGLAAGHAGGPSRRF